MAEQKPDNHGGEDACDLTVIYAAASPAEANLLRNLLAEAGIRAVVTNAALSGGAGVDVVGWATLARVAVARRNAPVARQIALEFDRTVCTRTSSPTEETSAGEEQPAAAASDAVAAPDWPRCPECDSRRATRCPICSTEGADFRPADTDYSGVLGVAEDASPLSTCGCGSDSCHKDESPGQATPEDVATSADAGEPADDDGAAAPPGLTLLCPICDEPFAPQYARRCRQCGHEFDEGFEVAGPREAEHFDYRLAALIAGVLAVVAGLFFYFATIVPGR